MNNQQIFDGEWLEEARSKSYGASWASAVVETLDASGQVYLATLRLWFDEFPAYHKDKQTLRKRLECFQNDQHLGGVNELAWWAFMQRVGIKAYVVPTNKASRPDFQLEPPVDCFIEVTTLNISANDKRRLENEEAIELDHDETIRRVLGKLTDEKLKQLTYAVSQQKPGVLVLFDYTEWSSFGTSFFNRLGKFLLGTEFGFKDLPRELSAIIYVERKVQNGQIMLSRNRSAAYYNPLSLQPLPLNSIPSLNQFWSQLASCEPCSNEHWILL